MKLKTALLGLICIVAMNGCASLSTPTTQPSALQQIGTTASEILVIEGYNAVRQDLVNDANSGKITPATWSAVFIPLLTIASNDVASYEANPTLATLQSLVKSDTAQLANDLAVYAANSLINPNGSSPAPPGTPPPATLVIPATTQP